MSPGQAGESTPDTCSSCSPPPGTAQDWPRGLVRKLAAALVFKLAVLGALWWWFFSPAHHPDARGPAVARHLLPGGSPK
jgi:hypothetical protein